ncbi:MAG: hypothetical protein EU529_07115 [Promethearchaeota archaeon]|nr:MAG: hypothetical protein EU529_07115 [Candidatus Lokiarchaeota archaeon]
MIDRLNAMYEELKELIDSRLGKEEIRFSCDLSENKLKDCIVEKAGKSEEDLISEDPYSRLLTSSILNCLDYGLSICVKNDDFKVSDVYKEAEFHVEKDSMGIWRINSITLKFDPKKIKAERILEIKNCINFFKQSCSKNREAPAIEINLQIAK